MQSHLWTDRIATAWRACVLGRWAMFVRSPIARASAVPKRLNRSTCHLGCGLHLGSPRNQVSHWRHDSPAEWVLFWGGSCCLLLVFLFSTILLRILFAKSESGFGLDSVKLSIQCANPNRESSFDVDCDTDRGIALVMVDDSSDGIATLWRHCCYDTRWRGQAD